MQAFVDEGYDSFSVGRNKIESALETLCSKRNDFYDTSSDCSTNSKKENFRSWDEIFDTVEKFSHNTTTFLSWVEEFKEVQHIKFDTSRDKRPSVNNWNKCVLDHLYRVYNKIITDGEKLQKDFQQERNLVSLILKNIAEEYENVASGCYGAMRGPPLEKKSIEEEGKKIETADSLLSSTLIYDLKKRKDRLPKDRQRLKIWWILIREREEALSWINEIRRKIDTMEIYYPQQRLRTLYKKYLIEIREQSSFKNSLKIICDFISEIFPELSHRSKKLVYETNQAQVELENYVMKKLIVLSPRTDHKAKSNVTHQQKSHNKNYSLTSLKRKQTNLNKNYKANRKEFNKDAEANKIITANNTIIDRENRKLNPYNFSEETLRLHHWLKDSEIKAIELFSTKPIGWNPDTLSTFLSKNKIMQDEIIENEKILKTMELESKLYKNKLQLDEETTTTLDTTNLQWALLMLRQRISTLSMFCLDVQCLIERRVDVTKLLNKKIKIDKLNHPIEDVWSELGIKMTKDDITVDKDYNV